MNRKAKKNKKPAKRKNTPARQVNSPQIVSVKTDTGGVISTREAQDFVTVRIKYTVPEDLIGMYSDVFFIQHTENDFTISFAQVQQPSGLLDEEYERLNTVEGKVLARIILTPRKMAELIQSLQINWNIFHQRFVKKPEGGQQ